MFFKKSKRGIITLLTDFGLHDPYVGIMKGVILKINPDVQIVDLSHEIPPQSIEEAAFALLQSINYFPTGTVHVAVVDPGVGTARKKIIIETNYYFIVAPDNGLAGYALGGEKNARIYEISEKKYMLENISSTFHGRDIFAPVGAYLSKGEMPEKIGKQISEYIKLKFPDIKIKNNNITAEIIHIDRFGNLITNLREDYFRKNYAERLKSVKAKNMIIDKIEKSYEQGRDKKVIAIFGSAGLLEISRYNANAAEYLKMKKGDKIFISLKY